jgi:hypothetical protein
MEDQVLVIAIAGVLLVYFLCHVFTRSFDPFAPVWLFLLGFAQVYVIQALSYHDWALEIRGKDLVTAANFRALWAIIWFLAVYQFGAGCLIARALPQPPVSWSPTVSTVMAPPLVIWGLFCAGVMIKGGIQAAEATSAEESLLRSFPFVMMVAAVMLIVTGRTQCGSRPFFTSSGLVVAAFYVVIWMFNGKRSHALIGVFSTICALYISRGKRPSWPVLIATLCAGALVVGIAIGWRNNSAYELSISGFTQYLSEFKIAKVYESLNLEEQDDPMDSKSHETTEYGGFLLMMDTVPEKSEYDYGMNYIRIVSTYIPRIMWPTKPLFGRAQWAKAWMAGSELERDEEFTGPAIGILGATQLNGGVAATLIVLAFVALLLRAAYEYFRIHADVPWVQFWWAITFFNAWFMVVGDDPLTWFYYNWGFSGFPIVVILWWIYKLKASTPRRMESEPCDFSFNGCDA